VVDEMNDMELVSESDGRRLYRRPDRDGWQNWKLEMAADEPRRFGRKQKWWLGWKEGRTSRDAKLLREHRPAAYDWVLSIIGDAAHA